MNYKFISIIPKSIDQLVEGRLLSRKTTLDERLTTILDDFPEDLIPIISAYVIDNQVSINKQIIDTFLKTHKKAAKTRKRLNSEQIDRLSMYLLYQLLEPDIPDMTRLETYFFESINILGDNRAGLYDGTGVTARLICGYIRITTREYEMGTFVNSMAGDYLHGQGTRYYDDGDRYEGECNDGQRHGQGTSYGADGSVIYKGEWNHGYKHGQGTMYDADGSVIYKGEWYKNERHGQGTYYWTDGSRYEGEFKSGKPSYRRYPHLDRQQYGQRHGQGTHFYANGDRYEGEWKDNEKHGQGTHFYANGARYEGEWKDNKAHGQGTSYGADGSVVYKGEWKDGKRHGQGTSYGADGSEEYRGKWKNNQPDHSRSLTSKISSFFKKNDFIPDE